LNIHVTGDLGVGRSSAGTLLACAHNTSVWVSSFSAETVGLSIFESVIHQTTIAAKVAVRSGAVNKFLLREGSEVVKVDGNNTFNTTSGGESPA
jgi:hypothetical protein